MLAGKPFSFEAVAPAPVEIIAYFHEEKQRYIIHLVNAQEQVPPIPVRNIKIKLNTNGVKSAGVSVLPEGSPLDFNMSGDFMELTAHELDIYGAIEVKL